MADLIALEHIQVGFREYQPGEALPPDHPEVTAWVESGSAMWRSADAPPPKWAAAKRVVAEAGLPGLAVGGEVTGDDLVGRIPATYERRRHR